MRLFYLLIFSLLLVSYALAVDVVQESYLSGETVQAYVETGNLLSSDIALVDENGTSVKIKTSFTEYRDGLYFLYFNLPQSAAVGNYTLIVQGVQDTFSVENITGESVIQLKPGFIILDSGDDTFSFQLVEVNNIATTVLISSSSFLNPRKSSLNIGAGEVKDLYVDYSYTKVDADMYLNLTYGSQWYTLPVFYTDLVVEEENVSEENATEEIEEVVIEEEIPFVFLVTNKNVEQRLLYNKSISGDLKLQNTVNHTLNLSYSFTGNIDDVLDFNQTEISLEVGEIYSQRIWFNRENNSRVGSYSGEIVVSDGIYSENISVLIEIVNLLESETVVILDVGENVSYEEIPLVYNGETLEEDEGNGMYIIGMFLIVLLLALIILVALKLRQKEDRKFHEYIEGTKNKK